MSTTATLSRTTAIGPALQFAGADVPDWVQLLPAPDAEGLIHTRDGRGPYRIADPVRLLTEALAEGPLPIDEAHATDLGTGSAPAMGWIEELQLREGAVWGRVEWTDRGRAAVQGRLYRGLSPVFRHTKDGTVTQLLRAGLVNNPNLRGLAALNFTAEEEDGMSLREYLAERLGLDAGASDEAILAALPDRGTLAALPALQSALGEAAEALGVDAGKPAAVAAAARTTRAAADQVAALQARLEELEDARAREASERWFDGLMAEGRIGVSAEAREDWIALHMEAPERAAALAGRLPKGPLGRTAATAAAPKAAPGDAPALNAEQRTAARLLGLKPEDYAATLAAERAAREEDA